MEVKLILFRENDGRVPLLELLDRIPEKALVKCLHRLERLKELGHLLRRPEADYLRDGVYELRVRHLKVNYRILYFFHGRTIVVVSHGLTKESEIPARDIDLAIERKRRFELSPIRYSAEE